MMSNPTTGNGTVTVTVTIFTSIGGVAQSLRDAAPDVPLEVVEDDALVAFGGTVQFDPPSLRDDTRAALKRAEVLVSEPEVVARLLAHDASALPSLRWCQSTYAGVNPLFGPSVTGATAFPPKWRLTRFAGCFGPPIAEWCVARIIGHERSFAASLEDQKHKSWAGSKDEVLNYRCLSSLTLSVLGCGDIGRCVARAAGAFGMRIVGYGRTERGSGRALTSEGIDEYTTNLDEALREADYIVSVLPSTPETRGLLDGNALRPSSEAEGGRCPVFINVGRGDVISEDSLLAALDNQWISASILDVFEVEPLPERSRLWQRSDVFISPHVSGLTQAKDVPKVLLDNYRRFVERKKLKFQVDWNRGY